MGRQDRKKASDIFRETNFVFSKKGPFKEAFPEIESATVEFSEKGQGVFRGSGPSVRTEKNLGEFIDCHNPVCYDGGFNIGEILRDMTARRETERSVQRTCQGYEGSPKGKKKYRGCLNSFDVKVSIRYKV